MKTPHLNRKLVLETPERIEDGAGGFSETWTPLGELWAEVTSRSGRERREGMMSVSATALKIIVRAAPIGAPARPEPQQRLSEGERRFLIIAVSEWDRFGRYLVCDAEEEVAG